MWGLYLKFLKLILLNLSCTRNSLNATKWIKEIAFLLEFRNAINEASSIQDRSIIPEGKLDGIFGSMPSFMSILNGVLRSVELHLMKTKKQIRISDIFLNDSRIFNLHVTLNREVIAQTTLLEKYICKYPRFRKALHQFCYGMTIPAIP